MTKIGDRLSVGHKSKLSVFRPLIDSGYFRPFTDLGVKKWVGYRIGQVRQRFLALLYIRYEARFFDHLDLSCHSSAM